MVRLVIAPSYGTDHINFDYIDLSTAENRGKNNTLPQQLNLGWFERVPLFWFSGEENYQFILNKYDSELISTTYI